MKDKRGQNTHWLIIFRDITERKRLEREILEISDRERQRIGQDLHDDLGQQLAGIWCLSTVLENNLKAERAGVVKTLKAAAGTSLKVDDVILEFE